jgi:transposase-like protein
VRALVLQVVQEVLEGEMDEALQAGKGERTPQRLGYRAGFHGRPRVTRAGKLELWVPQDRKGRFSSAACAARRPWTRQGPRCTSRGSRGGRIGSG